MGDWIIERLVDGYTIGWMVRWITGWVYCLMDTCFDGCMDCELDELDDGWADVCNHGTDRWMDRLWFGWIVGWMGWMRYRW